MRKSVLICFLLFIRCFAADADHADLRSLYENHRWFELRQAVAKGDAGAFYEGMAACAFDNLRECEAKLQLVFMSAPNSDDAVEGHRTLGSAYLRHGKYPEALGQIDALLAVRPKDADALGDHPLLTELAKSPDQGIAVRHTTVRLGDSGLPFSIHGVKATYWFDTGAELSVMTESEAKRFGLTPRDVATKIGDVNGTLFKTRVAVVDEVMIGPVRLRNVAFLVFSDDQPPFNEAAAGSKGLIGIPVLLALERFSWNADEKFEIGASAASTVSPHSELCFDDKHPVAQVRYQDRNLAFTIDTGATTTDLYPPFAAAFPELIRSAAKTNAYKSEGNGGAKYLEAATLTGLRFTIGGFPVVLKSTGVLLKPTTGSTRFFAGNLGIDLLQQAKNVTFDFKTMTLTLQ